MQVQQQGTVYRYNATGARRWVKPRRIRRRPSAEVAAVMPTDEDLEAMLEEVDQGLEAEAGIQPGLFEEE